MLETLPVRAQGKPRHSHGKINFAELARNIAAKWKTLSDDEKAPFEAEAAVEKDRYTAEVKAWKKDQERAKKAMRRQHEELAKKNKGNIPGQGHGVNIDAAFASMSNPSIREALHLPLPFGRQGVMMDESMRPLQHPMQQTDPAMLTRNTQPSFGEAARPWTAGNYLHEQDSQGSFHLGQNASQQTQNPFSSGANMSFSDYGRLQQGYASTLAAAGQDFGQAGMINSTAAGAGDTNLLPSFLDTHGIQSNPVYGMSSFFNPTSPQMSSYASPSHQYNALLANQERFMLESMQGPSQPESHGRISQWNNALAGGELSGASLAAQGQQMQQIQQMQHLQQLHQQEQMQFQQQYLHQQMQQQQQQQQHYHHHQQQQLQQQQGGQQGQQQDPQDEISRYFGGHLDG